MPTPRYYTGTPCEPEENSIIVDGEDFPVWTVDVTGEEYDVCADSSKNMACSDKPGTYGAGIANTKDDPYRVERTGRFGEMAFSKLTGLPVDIAFLPKGDECDFVLSNEKRIDVKTRTRLYADRVGLIRVRNELGVEKPPTCHYYVFSYVASEDKEEKRATVVFVGFCHRKQVNTYPEKKGYGGAKHKNKEVPYADLRPMQDILEYIRGCEQLP